MRTNKIDPQLYFLQNQTNCASTPSLQKLNSKNQYPTYIGTVFPISPFYIQLIDSFAAVGAMQLALNFVHICIFVCTKHHVENWMKNIAVFMLAINAF
jgi:hypothetical protein